MTSNNRVKFSINGIESNYSIDGSPEFCFGTNEILSSERTDITFHQPWYEQGFTEIDLMGKGEFDSLKNGLIESIAEIIEQECGINMEGFNLVNYHKYITDDKNHFKVVSRTRDLFSKDFSFPITSVILRLEELLGFNLSDINPKDKTQMHVIVRINRPQSNDYNPPHKDIYESLDCDSYIPQFVNFWIPVAGCNENSNLPLAPRSHLIKEAAILRTFQGGQLQGNKYRVRMIKKWEGSSALERSTVKYGQVLIFSSHLIHGLAVNNNADMTRVALEFRLFRKA